MVVASCSPKTHEEMFMETLEACGLNKYLFEMANIRNQDSWIHAKQPQEKATEKAKDLVRMAVARASTLRPLHEKKIPVIQKALVIGGGVAGMNAALGLADQGYETMIVEKEPELGGLSRRLTTTIEGAPIGQYLADLAEKVMGHEKIQVIPQALVVGFTGFKGNFTTELIVGPGMYERKIDHGVVILATGANEYQPREFLYGENDRVLTQIELARRLEEKGALDLGQVVMIQCVGSRNEENPNCSRVCCQNAVKNALHIKALNPDTDIYILYRDIRTYGLLEEYYTEARGKGVIFSRFTQDNPPRVAASGGKVTVTFTDSRAGLRSGRGRGSADPERRHGACRHHGAGHHHETVPQRRGLFYGGPCQTEAGGHGHRGGVRLRHGPQSQADQRGHCPGLCGLFPGHYLSGPGSSDPLGGDGPGGSGKMRFVPDLRPVMPLRCAPDQ